MNKENAYVVNLHLLEQCNYQCKHCFAHFDHNNLLSVSEWKQVIDNIIKGTSVSRFNLAGGEPLLYKGLDELIDYIHSKGIQVSIITNGFLLSEERIRKFNGKVSMIGLSIDALDPDLLRKLGRCTKSHALLDVTRCISLCKTIKDSGISLKINTVVSRLNQYEDFTDFIKTVQPSRWKILRMKRFTHNGFDNSDLEITEDQFKRFCSKYSGFSHIEETSLKNSYIIVDAGGRLLDNYSDGHEIVADLSSEDFKTAFNAMRFDKQLYLARYDLSLERSITQKREEDMDKEGKNIVFADGENFSWRQYDTLTKIIESYGETAEFRVYVKYSSYNVKNWEKKMEGTSGIVYQVFRDGKNAVDYQLSIDATDMAYLNKEINTFFIISSDADYCLLSSILRAKGKYVVGIGESKSSNEWRNACDEFVLLDNSPIVPDKILDYGFSHCQTDECGWILIAPFWGVIRKRYPDFHWEKYGSRATDILEKYARETGKIEINKTHPNAYRIRRKSETDTENQVQKNHFDSTVAATEKMAS